MRLITRTVLLLFVSGIAITLQYRQNIGDDRHDKTVPRERRALIKKKVGPIRQIFGLVYEQWNDTRFTYNTINNMLNDNFLPDNAANITTTTPAAPLNISTKPPPYRITRSELLRILRRNLKGINRLYNLELQDALKQSRITERNYNRNVSREISKYL